MPKQKGTNPNSIKKLKELAEKRELEAHNKLVKAIERLSHGKPERTRLSDKINPTTVAKEADLSRGTVYNHPDILEKIEILSKQADLSPNQLRKEAKEASERKEKNHQETIKQLNEDKRYLARENFKLSNEIQALNTELEVKNKELSQLKSNLLPVRNIISE